MTAERKTAYRFILWGVFCSVFHFETGGIQIFPAFVGYAAAAYGIYRLCRSCRETPPRYLYPALALLVAASLAGWVLTRLILPQASLPGYVSLAVPVLEFFSYYGCLGMMRGAGVSCGRYLAVYLFLETVGILSGLAGTILLWPAALLFMALALIAGKVIFFFCIWGESRKTEG